MWLINKGANGIVLKDYVTLHDNEYAVCNLKYLQNGFQAIFAHPEKIKLKSISN